jgi:hypothetical protein
MARLTFTNRKKKTVKAVKRTPQEIAEDASLGLVLSKKVDFKPLMHLPRENKKWLVNNFHHAMVSYWDGALVPTQDDRCYGDYLVNLEQQEKYQIICTYGYKPSDFDRDFWEAYYKQFPSEHNNDSDDKIYANCLSVV